MIDLHLLKSSERIGEPISKADSENLVEAFYGVAWKHYQKKNYEKAESLFTLLVQLGAEERFLLGLGASRQMLKNYEAALQAYAIAATMNENNCMPHYYAAQCFIALNEKQEAYKAIAEAKRLSTSEKMNMRIDFLEARI